MSAETVLNNVEITNNINTSTSSTTTQQHEVQESSTPIKSQIVAESSPSGAKAKLKEINAKDKADNKKQKKVKSSISNALNGSSETLTNYGKLTTENIMSEADEIILSYKDYTAKLEGLVHMLYVRVDQLEVELEASHKKINELSKRNTPDTNTNVHTEAKDDSKVVTAKKSKGKDKQEHIQNQPPAQSTPPSEKHEVPTESNANSTLVEKNLDDKKSEEKKPETKQEDKKSEDKSKKVKRNPKATINGEGN